MLTKEELRLMELVVGACTSHLMSLAGQMPTPDMRHECFKQVEELGAALKAVKEQEKDKC